MPALTCVLTLAAPLALVAPADAKPRADADTAEQTEAAQPEAEDATVDPDDPAGAMRRRFMIGIEGVVVQTPPLRTEVLRLDPRFIGRSVTMGGLGLFGRFRIRPILGVDLNVRSGSVRYRDRDTDDITSHDLIAADAGLLLYLGRGKIAQFALSSGIGGIYNRVRYEIDEGPSGIQQWGSGLVRVGAEAEFLIKRVAFVLSFRTYGVFTDRDSVSNKGELLDEATDVKAPVATLQTYLLGSAGLAFRF